MTVLKTSTAQDFLRRSLTARVWDLVRRTPLHKAPGLSTRMGRKLWLKREDMQVTYSFKLRGACNCMRQLSLGERSKGVVAASAG